MNRTYKLYLDMDGCLVDFYNGFEKYTNGLSLPDYIKLHGYENSKEVFFKGGVKFWENLDWISGGKELLDTATTLFNDVNILSSAATTDEPKAMVVEQGKRNWIFNNMPTFNLNKVFIVRGRKFKKEYASPNSILIDDLASTIDEWNENGGIGILHNSTDYEKTLKALFKIVNT